MQSHRYLSARRDAKGKAVFFSNSKLMLSPHWNESKKGSLRKIKIPLVYRDLEASVAASTTTAAITTTAAGVTRPGGTIRRRTVAAEPGEKTRTAGAVAGAMAGAGTVAACVLVPRAAVLHPAHQEVADQRRSADRHHKSYHPVRHGVLWSGRFGPERTLHRNIARYPAMIGRQMRRGRSLII